MKVLRFWSVIGSLALIGLPAMAEVRTAEQETKVIEEFVEFVKADKELPADQVQKAVEATNALKVEEEGRTLAITEGLRELYPAFRDALQALGEENLPVAASSLKELVTSGNPYLAAEASYFQARMLLLQERYEDAVPLLASLDEKFNGKSLRGGEALFLKGVAQSQMLNRKEAIESLTKYLEENPDAPERMKIGAWRQLEQLKQIQDETLSDVFSRMDFSRRRLALEDSGNKTQDEQKKIVSILEKLIKEAEEAECNCKGGGKGKGKKQGKGSESEGEGEGQGKGSAQGGNSGGGSKGTDSAEAERLRREGPRSNWSKLRDKDREAVFNAIKQKFPGRYQQLIEQYYKSFDEESDEG